MLLVSIEILVICSYPEISRKSEINYFETVLSSLDALAPVTLCILQVSIEHNVINFTGLHWNFGQITPKMYPGRKFQGKFTLASLSGQKKHCL